MQNIFEDLKTETVFRTNENRPILSKTDGRDSEANLNQRPTNDKDNKNAKEQKHVHDGRSVRNVTSEKFVAERPTWK